MATPTSTTPWKNSTVSGDDRVDALLGGTQWSGSSLTYSFPDTSSIWSTSASLGYGAQTTDNEPWSADFDTLATSDRADARRALDAWADVMDLTFTEVADNASVVGDIRMAYTHIAETADAQAWAYLPGSGPIAGDVWFNTDSSQYTAFWDDGSYEYQTVLHELGHALGLKHPFEGSVTLDPTLDSRSFTLMSYSAAPGDQNTYFSFEPTTPMILDIAAVQHLYGANTDTNKGDTTYTFNDSTPYHETLWDAGGNDTLLYTGTLAVTINLVSGVDGGSRIGLAVNVVDTFGSALYRVDNLWIADGATIENATSGNAADKLIGNAVANLLTGNGGNDSITGAAGNDTLDGGAGADTLTGGTGSDVYRVGSATDVINETTTASGDVDRVESSATWTLGSNLEKLTLTGTASIDGFGNTLANTVTGNGGANELDGSGGDDTLNGGAGNDTLDGGNGVDAMNGGGGSDVYVVGNTADTVTETFAVAEDIDRVESSVTWTLGDNIEKLTLTGSVAIDGTGNTLANTLTGNAAANRLSGLGGDDTLNGGSGNDTLDGGSGADAMNGGGGSDVYRVGSTGDVVTESFAVAGDIDRVESTVSWTLGANLEQLTLTGSGAINATGNVLANTLVGNAGANTLTGASGADTLTGGGGADIFAFNSLTGSDLITDFVAGTDDLRFSQAVIAVGDGDTVVDGAVRLGGPGGFSAAAELVILTANIAGSITTTSAAAAIGSATGNYTVGATRLFVVDNGTDSKVYLFTADDANAVVSASELQLLATLSGQASLTTGDVIFGG